METMTNVQEMFQTPDENETYYNVEVPILEILLKWSIMFQN